MTSAAERLLATLDRRPALTVVTPVDRKKPRDSKPTRIAAWKELIVEGSLEVFHEATDYLSHNFGRIFGRETLTEKEAVDLMREAVAMQTTTEALTARREMIRSMVYSHIAKEFAAADADDPENISGTLPVPALGKKFTKEGAGVEPPSVEWDVIKEHFTDEQWSAVVDRRTIPEHVEETPNTEKLIALLEDHPELAAITRKALVPGKAKTPKFHIRDLDEDTDD